MHSREANLRGTPGEERIYRALLADIQNGKLNAGETLPSPKQLQRVHGTSARAATYALRRLQVDGWIERRPGVGTFVGRKGKHRLSPTAARIGFIAEAAPAEGEFLRNLADALLAELAERGCRHETLSPSPDQPVNGGFDCLVCLSRTPWFTRKLQASCPVVYVAHDFDWSLNRTARYDVVMADGVHGGALAGRRLREANCRSVAVVGVAGRPAADWLMNVTPQRLAGFASGWGRAIPEARVVLTRAYDISAGAEAVQRWLAMDPRPEGVFCTSDDLAIGFQSGALAHRLAAGRDYSLIGFDGQPVAIHATPPITTVAVPMAELGRTAARLALERAAAPDLPVRTVALGCTLFAGATVVRQR